MPELPSQIDRRYELLEKLGEGGMGSVYKVRHKELGQMRVVKVIRPHHADDPQVLERFRREARAAIDLRHPNVAQIHDFWIGEDGRAFLVMELIEGLTFQRVLARRLPPLPLALEMARQALAALGYLHGKGYLHRDVAPDNLMLTRAYDGKPAVKLIDLGLIKRDAETLELTATNIFVGKIRYASPELFRRPALTPGPTSDLYSFATVLYEILTGVCPAQGGSFEELMTAHLLDPPPSFDKTDPDGRIPDGLRQVVLHALEKRPDQRFQSAEAFAAALEPFHDATAVPDIAALEPFYGPAWSPSKDTTRTVVDESVIATLGAGTPSVGADVRDAVARGVGADASVPVDDTEQLARTLLAPAKVARRWALAILAVALLVGVWAGLRWWRTTSGPTVAEAPAGTVETSADGRSPSITLSQGRLSMDARPWAEVVAITDEAGQAVAFDGPLYTPTILTLSPGAYTVTLDHPDLATPRRVAVRVPVTGTHVESVQLLSTTVDAFLDTEGVRDALERIVAAAP